MNNTFVSKLPEKWSNEELQGTRINLMAEGVVTLVGIKRLESEALFVSSEGGGTLRETAKVDFAGVERYWWIARKVNGVVRRVLLSSLKEECTVDQPCISCEVCRLFGGMRDSGDTKTAFSRLKLQDLISVQEYNYDEKFRVRLPNDPTSPKANPVPYQEVIVPPGTEFPFIVRIIKPSQRDLGLFLFGNRIADELGYGNYSKMRGNASTQWLAIASGFMHLSVYDLLTKVNDISIEDQVKAYRENPLVYNNIEIISGEQLQNVVDELVCKVSPNK